MKERLPTLHYIVALVILGISFYLWSGTANAQEAPPVCIDNPAACADPAPVPVQLPAPVPAGTISPAPIIDGYGNELPNLKPFSNKQLQGWHDDAASEGVDRRAYQHYLACWNNRAIEQAACSK